jgi:PncC family amidohydrolase
MGKSKMIAEEMLGGLLRNKGLKIGLAESCTGGLIANRLTNVPGASDYFDVGVVTYSNRAKEVLLAVPSQVLAAKGAVSSEVAALMAQGARRVTGTDMGLAVTGIAGPEGGAPQKPVGTVFIALSVKEEIIVRHYLFQGDRESVKEQTSEAALSLAIQYLEGRLT